MNRRRLVSLARQHARVEGWLRMPDAEWSDQVAKPPPYLPIYERLLNPLRPRRFAMLELGVWKGDSLAMWRDAFPRATIVGVDLALPQLDLGPRVRLVQGDQTDAELLRRAREQHAPEGFELIIDDASHIGELSARSLQALYEEHLKPGGLYVIEDWGTGYVPDWPDGGPLAERLDVPGLDATPMRSHEHGMVGLVKRLVDHLAGNTVRLHNEELTGLTIPIERLTVYNGLVVLRKPRA